MNTHSIGIVFLWLFFSVVAIDLTAQQRNTQLKVYGHLQYSYDDLTDAGADSYFSLGEQDFFVTSNLSDRISFLGETVVRYDNATASKFAPSIERAQLKFDYYKNHSYPFKLNCLLNAVFLHSNSDIMLLSRGFCWMQLYIIQYTVL